MALAATGIPSFGVLLWSAASCLLITGLFFRRNASGLLVFCCIALVSACRFMLVAVPRSEREIVRLRPQLPLENIQLIGRVLYPPEYRANHYGDLGTWVVLLECEGLRCGVSALEYDGLTSFSKALSRQRTPECSPSTNNPATITQNNPEIPEPAWKKYHGRIQVRIGGAPPAAAFRQGGRVCFSGTLRWRNFPGGEPVELVVAHPGECRILSGPPRFSPLIWGRRLRERAARVLSNGMGERAGQLAVYRALLLGYRKAVPPGIYQLFRRTGTLHIFAISGLHVGIIGLLITIVLKSIGIPRDRWGIGLLPLLLAYVVITGMKSSALRALAMAAVYFLAPLLRRKPDIPVSIAFAAILLLLFKPLEILSAGFIFSFTVVSFIVMLFSRVPMETIFRGEGWLRGVHAYVASLGITSSAAFMASLPLTTLFFGSFSPVSLLANFIVVPLTFCIVLCGWLAIVMPFASDLFNHAALFFINGLLGTTGLLARLPCAFIHVPPPSLTALLLWYWGWIHLLVHARSVHQRINSFILVALAVILAIF